MVIERPSGTQAAPAGCIGQELGNLNGLKTATVAIVPLAVDQAALDVASGRGNAVAVGVLEGTVLGIEEGKDHPVQADLQTLHTAVTGIVVAQLDELLAIAGSAVGVLQGSELLCELGQLGREALNTGLQDLLLTVVIAALVHQMLAVGTEPDAADGLSGTGDGVHGNHDNLIGTEELGSGAPDVLFHVGRGDVPGTLRGAHIEDVEHGGRMPESDELPNRGVGQAGVLLLELLKLRGAIFSSAGVIVHNFQIPSF